MLNVNLKTNRNDYVRKRIGANIASQLKSSLYSRNLDVRAESPSVVGWRREHLFTLDKRNRRQSVRASSSSAKAVEISKCAVSFRTSETSYLMAGHGSDHSLKDCPMILLLSIVLLLSGAVTALADTKGAMICVENGSITSKRIEKEKAYKFDNATPRTFSVAMNGDYLNVITKSGSETYECQKIKYRSNKKQTSNTLQCQNATNFITIDLRRMKFIKSRIDSEGEIEFGLSYGSCKMI